MKQTATNIFDYIDNYWHDEDFNPEPDAYFLPTSAPPGSAEKIAVLIHRAQQGHPLWHKDDKIDFSGVRKARNPNHRTKHDVNSRRTGSIKVCITPRNSKSLSND